MTLAATITEQADLTALNTTWSIIGFVFYVLIVVALWKVFSKAGYPGWLAIIPIVNAFILVKVAGFSAWLGLLYLIPIVNIVFYIIVALRVGKAFGHGAVFSIFLLWIFSFVGYLILGFGSDTYDRSRIA
jgi:hypothetical protein